MSDAERADEATRVPQRVGDRLRAARERGDLSLAEIAARTRVPLRHLEAIEASDYGQLPSPTYAVGFVRAYARAIGEDEVTLARDTREEASRAERPTPQYQPYEIADPRRVPSRGLVIVTAGLAVAIVVLAILWFATGLMRGGEEAPPAASPSVAVAVPAAVPTRAVPRDGLVTLTAADEVWLRVYDAAGTTLYLGTMKAGEKFDVPATASGPRIDVGRPDKLQITLNGSAIAPLGDGRRPLRRVPIDGASLAARASGEPAPAQPLSPVPSPSAAASVPPAFAPTPRASTARPAARAAPRAAPRRDGPENLLPSGFATGAPNP